MSIRKKDGSVWFLVSFVLTACITLFPILSGYYEIVRDVMFEREGENIRLHFLFYQDNHTKLYVAMVGKGKKEIDT